MSSGQHSTGLNINSLFSMKKKKVIDSPSIVAVPKSFNLQTLANYGYFSKLVVLVLYLSTHIIFHQPILNKKRLVFVRHGEYDIASGSLTEMGRAKINRVGKLPRKHYPSVSAIYHSCITRSKESASIIVEKYSGVRMCPSKLLNEFQVDKNY